MYDITTNQNVNPNPIKFGKMTDNKIYIVTCKWKAEHHSYVVRINNTTIRCAKYLELKDIMEQLGFSTVVIV